MPATTTLLSKFQLLDVSYPATKALVIEHACSRLEVITRRMLKNFPVVRRWSETGDVLQASLIRLHKALDSVVPTNSQEFYGLAITQIRRELIDLARQYNGAYGIETKHHSDPVGRYLASTSLKPESLEDWTLFHESVDRLPQEERHVVELLWYDDLTQQDAAEHLGISLATLKRRWASARVKLSKELQDWSVD